MMLTQCLHTYHQHTHSYADQSAEAKNTKSIKNDEIVLATHNALEKLSYSFAAAQSAKLFVFEERLGK